jgi:formate dehydrogenase iron-sulfur subunit
MEPACAKACPTQSIQFGPLTELRETAQKRVDALHSTGVSQARLYGADDSVYGGLNAFFLLMDEPEAYRLPNAANAKLPSRNNERGYLATAVTAVLAVLGGLIALRRRREPKPPAPPPAPPPSEPVETAEAGT